MELIRKFIDVKPPVEQLLTKEQALLAFDMFLDGNCSVAVKHKLCEPLSKIELLYQRLVEIRQMIERIVKREARLVREEGHWEVDKTTEEQVWIVDVEEELCPVPTTLDKLKERALQLVQNDYDVTEPLFVTDNIMDLVEGMNYVIDQIIINSNSTKDATFSWWKTKVIENA